MDFYKILLSAHKGFAYLELGLTALFIVALLTVMFGYSGKVNKLLKKVTLFTMIFFHVQFTLGVIMLITSPGLKVVLAAGELMKDGYRQTFVEHPFSMLIAAVLMTIINRKVKSNDTISLGIVIMGLIAVGLFAFAFPWTRVFGA
ncbi:hypothetical protein NAL32_14145 [Chryseobacterium sp. Ch-15]|uniref:50S ribosomal protein L27 n=1 Tax=Chryseobacterium muglaense TaxID=2893752 RepID=A0A9Q3USS7_9FLAO|nr:hypothetical protein [Chryseobacterium muglaense]MBD3905574.1 hypothetical protein [Chryseobacterium muglaense]MCC9034948.1 hypothetical protein [Chryseobacterium muglaense]MCM2555520.1 hypothetical protein [Chryseobacterium muglaense]